MVKKDGKLEIISEGAIIHSQNHPVMLILTLKEWIKYRTDSCMSWSGSQTALKQRVDPDTRICGGRCGLDSGSYPMVILSGL